MELPSERDLGAEMEDVGQPVNLNPHIGSGLGGSTQYWHNGLIEIEDSIFASRWPFPKSTLSEYYNLAFKKLSGISQDESIKAFNLLKQQFQIHGVLPELLNEGLFYSSRRKNIWDLCKLNARVKIIRAEAIGFSTDGKANIQAVKLIEKGAKREVAADMFVLSAGGLCTPLLLQELRKEIPSPSLMNAGLYYEDHPTAFVAEVVVRTPIYKLWNYKSKSIHGSFRLPMVVTQNGLRIAFQLRPAFYLRARNKLVSTLNTLRNRPWNILNYLRLFTHWDDVLEVLSFKFGFNMPTNHFSLLMIAEQSSADQKSIWKNPINGHIIRNWVLSKEYLNSLEKGISQVLQLLGDIVSSHSIYVGWQEYLSSSAHHSGTARMHADPKLGVCNSDGRVYGITNLYVCDGSIIPASGSSNTGLTIAALALRLADYLKGNEIKTE